MRSSNVNVAIKVGLLEQSIDKLLKGKADIGTATKLGVVPSILQEFLDGRASVTMAMKFGLLKTDLDYLLDQIGKDGAKALILGYFLNTNSFR